MRPKPVDTPKEQTRTTRERDLFRALLGLAEISDLRAFIEGALAIAVDLTSADRGYVALFDPLRGSNDPRWWTAHGWDDADLRRIRSAMSTGVMAETVSTEGLVRSVSAIGDVRFAANESVRRNGIEAVLCAPIGSAPVKGVVYLQGRPGAGPFTDDDVDLLGCLATSASGFAERLIAEAAKGPRAPDPTAPWRARLDVSTIIGRSPAIALVLEELAWIAPSPLDVLIRGPSGAGKTLFAAAIHRNSPRRGGPLMEVNCSAIPETLFEGALFGTVKGAFTDAITCAGYVAMAEGGTLFLDEIGDLPLVQQGKLLTFLESRSYHPVGAPGRPVQANVRVIAATNIDLKAAIREKKFREDLYFRLNVASVRLPSLSERREDIVALAQYFLDRVGTSLAISPGAELALELASWPGDVRELYNTVQTAIARAQARRDGVIARRHLFPDPSPKTDGPATLQEAVHAFKREYVLRRLRANRWNISATARDLDVGRGYLYTLMQVLGIRPSDGNDDN